MNLKAWIPLIIAVVLGLIAAMFAMNLTRPDTTVVTRLSGTVDVVTAVRNIAPGEVITANDVALRSIVAADAPEGTFVSIEQVQGRVANTQLVAGQPVLRGLLAPEGMEAGLQALIPEGMRAITIEINEFSGLAGMIRPGAIVDVVSTLQGNNEDAMARTIVQGVRVTAVGQRVSPIDEPDEETPPARSVTLLVTPEQAEQIELAAVTSRPRLVLRSPADTAPTQSRGVTLADLRGRGPGQSDPFLTRPVSYETPVRLESSDRSATTQPADQTVQIDRMLQQPGVIETREVTIIRGGVESRVMLQHRRTPHLITGVDVDTVELNK